MPSIPLIIDTTYAENLNARGNRCTVTFSPPLQLPRDAQPRLRLYSSSFAYNFPNLSATFGNNTLVINRTTAGHSKTITFPDGLYGTLDDISRSIKHALHGDTNFNSIDVTLIGVAATQKVHVEVKNDYADVVTFSFTSANSIGSLIGFTTDRDFAANSTVSHEGNTTAALDRTTSVLLQTSLCSGSVVQGKGGSSTLAMIHLGGEVPASVVAYQPNNMLEVPANLAGGQITSATFALVNQAGEDVDTLNEKWQAVIEIAY